MENKNLNPSDILQKIVNSLGYAQKEKENILAGFRVLCTNRLGESMSDYLKGIPQSENLTKLFTGDYIDEEIFVKQVSNLLSSEENYKIDKDKILSLYVNSIMSSFVDVLGVIEETANSEEKMVIRKILSENKLTQELFQLWQENHKSL